jgi:hypothetical protein
MRNKSEVGRSMTFPHGVYVLSVINTLELDE